LRETDDRPVSGVLPFAETLRRMLAEISAVNSVVGIAAPGMAAKDGRT